MKPLSYSRGHTCHLLGAEWPSCTGWDRHREGASPCTEPGAVPATASAVQQMMDCCLSSFHMTNLQLLIIFILAVSLFWRLPSSVEKGSSSADHRCLLFPFWDHHRHTGACAGICTVFGGGTAPASNKRTRLQRYIHFREVYPAESLLNIDQKINILH